MHAPLNRADYDNCERGTFKSWSKDQKLMSQDLSVARYTSCFESVSSCDCVEKLQKLISNILGRHVEIAHNSMQRTNIERDHYDALWFTKICTITICLRKIHAIYLKYNVSKYHGLPKYHFIT